MLNTSIIEINNKLYLVNRKIRVDNDPILSDWKLATKCDSVFKKGDYYYLCNLIEDIEFEMVSYLPSIVNKD
jgi:hypothetical protein